MYSAPRLGCQARLVPAAGPASFAADSVAVLADVHGNAVALEAVCEELLAAGPDAVVFLGDLTCGPLPEETWNMVELLRDRLPAVHLVRGNTERALLEARAKLAAGRPGVTARERWLIEAHRRRTREAIAAFAPTAVGEIDGLGFVRFCHGSPRSDEEMITSATPAGRMRALIAGVDERILVSGHTHIQFDRVVASVRSINPGSVGLPYEGAPGAYWALLAPDVDLRQTSYDVELAVARFRATTDPFVDALIEMLLEPPTRDQVIVHAEALVYSS